MTSPVVRRMQLRAVQDAVRRGKWGRAAALARGLDPEDGDAALAGLTTAIRRAVRGEAPVSAALAAGDAIADFDHYRFLDAALGADRSPLASIAQALDARLTFDLADGFLLEFPKCGRTWLRTMIGLAVQRACGIAVGDPTDLRALALADPRLPEIEVSHDDYPQLKRAADVATDKSVYRRHKVALLVRDPRDVVVSYYFQRTRRGEADHREPPFEGTLAEFVRHPIGSIDTIVAYYNAWAGARDRPAAFRLVTYESLRSDTAAVLRDLLDFFGFPRLPAADLDGVVDECRFERMREREASGAYGSQRLRPGDAGDPESFKVRRGVVGGYLDYLAPADVEWVDRRLAAGLDPLYAAYRESRR